MAYWNTTAIGPTT